MRKTKKQRKQEKRIKLRNKKIVKEYPFLIPCNAWTGKKDPDYDYTYTMLMDGGWKKLQINFFKEIKPLLIESNFLNKYTIVQLKEKFGQIRIYTNGVPKSISDRYDEIENKYVALSEQTCIKCGKPAKICNINGWFEPYCENCMEQIHNNYNKYRKEPTPFKYENYLCDEI